MSQFDLRVFSQSAFRTALLLPSILRRVDDLLLVKELNAKFFDHSIAENHLHEAISSPSSLVEIDYERLELLGKSQSPTYFQQYETHTNTSRRRRVPQILSFNLCVRHEPNPNGRDSTHSTTTDCQQ